MSGHLLTGRTRRYRVIKLDPIVEEVRKARETHAAKFGYNLSAICADLKQKEKSVGIRLCLVSQNCG